MPLGHLLDQWEIYKQFNGMAKPQSTVKGMSVESLQAYSYAADLVDVSLDTLTGSMAKNVKSMSNAAQGSAKYADAYKQLGVSVTNADGSLRNSEDVYWEVIDALGKVSNETERDALAMQLFGKSAQDLNPLIAQGSAGIAALTDEAHRIASLTSVVDALRETVDQNRTDNKESHDKIWRKNYEQDDTLNDHETRIAVLEHKS